MSKRKHFLWLMPEGDAYDALHGIIAALARRCGGPVFEPHITLLGSLEGTEKDIIGKTEELCDRLLPFDVSLSGIGNLDEYYRCLFAVVTKSDGLMNAYQTASAVFGRHPDPLFMPHVSLLYGNFPGHIKRDVIDGLGEAWKMDFPVFGTHLISAGDGPETWVRSRLFPFRRI